MGKVCCTTTPQDFARGGNNAEMYETMELFKTGQLKFEQKQMLISKFGEGRSKWNVPVSDIEKQFAVELIIL